MKRKIELAESLPNKVNTITKPKAPLKAEVIVKLKELQDKYDSLKKENDQNLVSLEAQEAINIENLKIIKELNNKLELLEKEKAASNRFKCEECDFGATDKTELSWHLCESHGWPLDRDPEDLDMSRGVRFCSKCDYQAEDGYDMDGHKWGEHDDEDLDSLRCNSCNMTFSTLRELMHHKKDKHGVTWTEEADLKYGPFSCNLCDETFKTVSKLMLHNQNAHKEKLAECWKFSAGECTYGDKCWFKHSAVEERRSLKFDCNKCEKRFTNVLEFRKHRKSYHANLVEVCRNTSDGSCSFGAEKCWFRHTENEKVNDENDSSDNNIIQKVFKMMENMTERIMKMENKGLQLNEKKYKQHII